MKGESSSSAAALAPGFRFHPTDEELVSFYLKRKVCGKPFRFDAISEIDIYRSEPWDLPDRSRLKSRDLEWYFFSALDKKYGNGSRTNRTTEKGYWKTTGKDRPVRRATRTVGMKKTLVFHKGRAPRGERTNWVMHEYRLVDEELGQAGVVQDAFVLCRIFQKSGSGPKNGEQYGAPFIEEEWEDTVLVPREAAGEEAGEDVFWDVGNDFYVQQIDLEQNVDAGIPSENVPLPLSFCYEDDCNYLKDPSGFLEDDQKLLIDVGEKDDLPELPDDQQFFDLPELYQMDPVSVTDESFVELDDLANPVDANYHALGLVDELGHVDASHITPPVNDGLFLEISDISNPVESDPLGFDMEEYLTYFNDIEDNSQYVALDSSKMLEGEVPVLHQSKELVNGGIVKAVLASPQPLKRHGGDGASSSKQYPEGTKSELDVQNGEGWDGTLFKRASRMLGCIPAPPAFASEFPTKEATVGKNSATHSSNSIHVTTGMIQISSMTINGNGKDWSLDENRDVNFMLYGMTRGDLMAADHLISNSVGLEPMSSLLSSNAGSVMVRSGFYLIFFSVMILSLSFKIGTYIYSK